MSRVLVADAAPVFRLALRMALTASGHTVTEAGSGPEAVKAAVSREPHAVLIDSELDPSMNHVREICERLPGVSVIVLSVGRSAVEALAAVRAGACGFVSKDTPPERLPAIVAGAIAGEAAIPRQIVRQLLAELAGPSRRPTGLGDEFSVREAEVLELLSQGLTDRLVGERLGVSEVTVRRHAATAMRKLNVQRRQLAIERYRSRMRDGRATVDDERAA